MRFYEGCTSTATQPSVDLMEGTDRMSDLRRGIEIIGNKFLVATRRFCESVEADFAEVRLDTSKKWDKKAFFSLTLHQSRRLFEHKALKSLVLIGTMLVRQAKPRRMYNRGVRFALCDTRVI